MKLPTFVVGILGFIGDFLNPVFNTLLWSITLIVPVTFLVWFLHGKRPESRIRARALLSGLIATFIFGIIFLVNALTAIVVGTSGQQDGPPDKSFFAALITPIGALQESMLDTMRDMDGKLADIRDSNLRQEQSLSEIKDNTRRTTEDIRDVGRSMDLTVALSLLDRAKEARDGSMQGQTEALQSLIAKGYEYENVDFSGINFKGAQLAGINLKGAKLHWSDFRGANLTNSKLARTQMQLAQFDNTTLDYSSGTHVYAPLLSAQGSSFRNSDFSQAVFIGADFRNADFSGAKLHGTVFVYADLRGANFSDANLTDTSFIGAILDDALFDNATFENTDMRAANAHKFDLSKQQLQNVCQYLGRGRDEYVVLDIDVYERFPSVRFPSGYEQSRVPTPLGEGFLADGLSLPVCSTQPDSIPYFYYDYAEREILYLDTEYLSKAGRRHATRQRVDNHMKLFMKNIKPTRFLRLDNSEVREWEKYIYDADQRVEPVGEFIVDKDFFLLHLLSRGLVRPSEINWHDAYESRYYFEKDYDDNEIKAYNYWQRFFPAGAPLQDMPAGAPKVFREWTLKRLKYLPDTFVVYGRIRTKVSRNRRSGDLVFSLNNMSIIDRSGTSGSFSWPKSMEKNTDIPEDRFVSRTTLLTQVPNAKLGFLAISETLKNLKITVPANEAETMHGTYWVRLEMRLDKIAITSPEAAIAQATALNVALIRDSETSVAWQRPFAEDAE